MGPAGFDPATYGFPHALRNFFIPKGGQEMASSGALDEGSLSSYLSSSLL